MQEQEQTVEQKTEQTVEQKSEQNVEHLLDQIKTLQLKLDEQDKALKESNNKFISFVHDYMNQKHEEIKQKAEETINVNDKKYDY